MANISDVPVIVVEADDRKAMELALIENLQLMKTGAIAKDGSIVEYKKVYRKNSNDSEKTEN